MSHHGFNQASPIQNMTIEPILLGKDIFAQAETGSGKTGAFAIPILEKIMRFNQSFLSLFSMFSLKIFI